MGVGIMATFVRVGDRGINCDHLVSWHYDLPTATSLAQITLSFADGHTEQLTELAADALAWHLDGLAADVEGRYMRHWEGQAALATATAKADARRREHDAQYAREQAAADAHDAAWARSELRAMGRYLEETM